MKQTVLKMVLRSSSVVSALVVLLTACSPAWSAENLKQAPTRTYEVSAFKGISVPGSKAGMTVDVFVSDDLARTPRHYLRVGATVKATGPSEVAIILVDVLKREYRGPMVKLTVGKETQISVDVEKIAGRPVSMLRGVRLFHKSKADRPANAPEKPGDGRLLNNKMVRVSALRITCADELLPKPDATVTGPRNAASIQKALDSLGPKGGVLYIPAGRYVFKKTVTIPADNITIYGDGRDTIIAWPNVGPPTRGTPLRISGRKNIRLTRLHFQGPPITAYRGYSENRPGLIPPEDAKRARNAYVNSYGIVIRGCRNVRVDHCEIELFGLAGVMLTGGGNNLVDHCYLHENFRAGYGYGISNGRGKDGTERYIEDSNFENHRHALAGTTNCGYTARFNRMVKDKAVMSAWKQSRSALRHITSHEIDGHGGGGGWMHIHDNYVSMRNGMMAAGQNNRGAGNPGWFYRNLLENCKYGLSFEGKAKVWVWGNRYINCPKQESFGAPGSFQKKKPPNFKESYPHKMNRFGYWPGTSGKVTFVKPKSDSLCAGPEKPALLREVAVPTGR